MQHAPTRVDSRAVTAASLEAASRHDRPPDGFELEAGSAADALDRKSGGIKGGGQCVPSAAAAAPVSTLRAPVLRRVDLPMGRAPRSAVVPVDSWQLRVASRRRADVNGSL